MFNIKANLNQEKIEQKVNKIIFESGIDENNINMVFDSDTMILDILYDGNTILDTMDLMNYVDIEINRI